MDTEDPVRFAKDIGVRYPLVAAADDRMEKFGGVVGIPTPMLDDRRGIHPEKGIGFEYTDVTESELKPPL
jgi:hypothetical protein